MRQPRKPRACPSLGTLLALRMLLPLLLQGQRVDARICVSVPTTNGDEYHHNHQCTDDPLVLTHAVDPATGVSSNRYNLGLDQRIDGTESEKQAIRDVLVRMDDYYIQEVLAHPEYAGVRNRCQNLNELCAFWVAVGECESNRLFMLSNCALSCRFCLLLNTDIPLPWQPY